MKSYFVTLLFITSVNTIISQEDHTDYLEGPFESPQEITATCLECHDGVQEGIMAGRHWNWLRNESEEDSDSLNSRGKVNIINNFCIAVSSNWPRCTSCHIGYGWENMDFDFNDEENIDCLVCHDQTGTYIKTPTGAGMPSPEVDLEKVAQSVGPTTRQNCGTCHFNGGGGTGVKHGDLDESLIEPSGEIDFHMGELEFQCSECHYGEDHQIIGASHGSMSQGLNHTSCAECHSDEPHSKEILNTHGNTIACETCHIPTIAKEIPTKIWWDWSKAGLDQEAEKDEFGMETYNKKKGEFVWAKNLTPQYTWYNGKADYYKFGDKIDASTELKLNNPNGDINDSESKITPFKIMRGKQIYDSSNEYLIIPKLFGEGGYWQTFDWKSASELGMKSVDMDFSGNFDFVETVMYWPVNHMVAGADDALKCTACHGTKGNKLLDWNKLGYKSDPMKSGSRLKK